MSHQHLKGFLTWYNKKNTNWSLIFSEKSISYLQCELGQKEGEKVLTKGYHSEGHFSSPHWNLIKQIEPHYKPVGCLFVLRWKAISHPDPINITFSVLSFQARPRGSAGRSPGPEFGRTSLHFTQAWSGENLSAFKYNNLCRLKQKARLFS